MVIEDFESLDAWRVWPDAWGGKAELAEAEAPAVGNAAVRITAPGIIYRELAALDGRVAREPQCRGASPRHFFPDARQMSAARGVDRERRAPDCSPSAHDAVSSLTPG